ncbi:MAG: hypothetical protein OES32_07605 [Acidobacteriota bacterium]|nr:hypothetical protein [Acidobacteriota bacterium]MDH3523439.1 hypothetical protein [Acidobacteriota bacterium]
MNRKSLIILGIVAVAIVVAAGTVIRAQDAAQARACAGCEPPQQTQNLPRVERGPMDITPVGEALSVLSFDDGTCESGLGAGVTVTDYVDFDVPTQCIQSGLDVVQLTSRMNTGIGTAFAFGQAGPAAPPANGGLFIPVPPLPAFGACPATQLTSRPVGPGAAVVTGTSNFYAGLRTPTGFAGRDTNGPPAGRIWLDCALCGMTQYTPTTLTNLGLGGNWMIRVTVEDANCVPVELMGFDVS